MNPKKGLATWAGVVAAVGQYAAAVAVFLEADNQSDALAPLVTATVTLLAVVVGRMQQAKALAARPVTSGVISTVGGTTGWTGHVVDASTWTPATAPGTRALGEPTDLSLEVPGGGFPQDGERP